LARAPSLYGKFPHHEIIGDRRVLGHLFHEKGDLGFLALREAADCAVNRTVPSGAGWTSCAPARADTGKVRIAISARTGLPAVDINNTAASIMPSRIIDGLLLPPFTQNTTRPCSHR